VHVITTTQEHVSANAAFLVILGFFLGMFGLIAVAAPLAVGIAIEMIVGILLLGRGSMQLYYGLKVRHWGSGLLNYMGMGSVLMALLSVACGVLMIVAPMAGLTYLTLLLAAYLVITGAFEILHAVELRSVRGAGAVCLNGMLGVLLGWLIWRQWPISGSWAIGVITGASMLLSGATLAALGMAGRAAD
jgi:uncharacterized membrane protein HdeD (DUF308 family)